MDISTTLRTYTKIIKIINRLQSIGKERLKKTWKDEIEGLIAEHLDMSSGDPQRMKDD